MTVERGEIDFVECFAFAVGFVFYFEYSEKLVIEYFGKLSISPVEMIGPSSLRQAQGSKVQDDSKKESDDSKNDFH